VSTPANHWKLGLFVVVGVCAAAGSFFFFGARAFSTETVSYKTFFNESVQGLEVGSPVKFRGVTIGSVDSIDIAPDRRHVEVTYELGVKVLDALGLAVEKRLGQKRRLFIPPDLHAQLAASGITGVKFIQMDFFAEKTNPPIELPFALPENHIPAVGSVLKNLEDSVVRVVDGFPEVMRQVLVVLDRISAIVTDIEGQHLPEQVSQTLTGLKLVLASVNRVAIDLEPGALSKEARAVLANINTAVVSLNEVLARVGGDRGLAASLQHTSDSLGAMSQNASAVGPAIEDVSREVQSAARAVQRLAEAIELDPDMLIKGRGKRASK
jgi:phospholipid/cholesterol/gamma-HCH transport system substrate-binding protein